MRLTRRGLLIIGLLVCCATAGTLVGATLAGASGVGTSPVAAFTSSSAPPATDQTFIQGLAADEGTPNPGTSANPVGTPLPAQARDLIANAGPAHDTLGAFPTSSGEVCFEVLGAGDCGNVNGGEPYGAGISFGILGTRTGGTRLYGVASDYVAKVDVEIAGTDYPATLSNNGFYFALPDGITSDHIQSVVATWKDGSVHTYPMHS